MDSELPEDVIPESISLDALDDYYASTPAAENPTESFVEAIEEGLTYDAPDTPPIVPGGEDDASIAEGSSDNEGLARAVLAALEGNPATDGLRLRFQIHQGVVHLHGRVADRDTADEVVRTVYAVDGVDRVVSHLAVD